MKGNINIVQAWLPCDAPRSQTSMGFHPSLLAGLDACLSIVASKTLILEISLTNLQKKRKEKEKKMIQEMASKDNVFNKLIWISLYYHSSGHAKS